jgi:hypothetical protein
MISGFQTVLFGRILKRRVIFRFTVNLMVNNSSKENCMIIYTYNSTRILSGYMWF